MRLGHVDVQQPDVAASLDALPAGEPVVIVPLLLSAGLPRARRPAEAVRRARRRHDRAGARSRRPARRRARRPARTPLGLGGRRRRRARRRGFERRPRERGLPRDRARCSPSGSAREVTVGFLAAAEPRLGAAVASRRRRRSGPRGRRELPARARLLPRPRGAPRRRRARSRARCSTTTSRRHPSSTSSSIATAPPRTFWTESTNGSPATV